MPILSSQRYTQLVHYYTYEWASFIADVGGFLGLLLGYSVLRDDTYLIGGPNWEEGTRKNMM